MEMNTRLQVEHPVTEAITGQDLVEWQLRVASGEALPKRQEELRIGGWAMEARLYAEDPAKGFLPSIGRLETFRIGGDCRIDSGVEEGAEISPFYDPMIAKLIAHGPDREAARRSLRDALAGTIIWPLRTNAAFLVRALDNAAFAEGRIDTGLIARGGDALMPAEQPSEATLARAAERLIASAVGPAGFRLNAGPRADAPFLLNGAPTIVRFDPTRASATPSSDTLVVEKGQTWRLAPWRVDGSGGHGAGDGAILSPMPGRIIAVSVAAGDRVTKGQKLVTVEAMKMEHSLVAPFDGRIAELNASEGGQVSEGALLVRIEAQEEA
jgi:3-methylcrotonyl-CoA carboxylase alpha subunit